MSEEQIKEVIEQIGYQEFYRYYEDKDVLIRLQKKEIDKLNNIINELERYIGNEYYCFDNESLEFKIAKDILDKLQELKGSEKE